MKLKGIGAAEGVACARMWRMTAPDLTVAEETGREPEEELRRFSDAQAAAVAELTALYDQTARTDGKNAMIFDVHRMMVEDLDFTEGVRDMLLSTYSAEWAVQETGKALSEMFAALEDETMKARAADVRDVSGRVIRILKGLPEAPAMPREPVIVAAEDLLPSQTVKLDKRYVAGCVTRMGSAASHSAILARAMGIGCVVGLGEDFDRLPEECVLAIDGSTGEVVVNPTPEEAAEYDARREAFLKEQSGLKDYFGREAVTKSGHRCLVCANIGSVKDAEAAKAAGADGVGLFRSEFLYLDSPDFPSEEKQFEAYRRVLELFAPAPVVVRTLDLGSDKQAPYFRIPGEENPAMGYRAIRICLDRPDIFRTQLRALLRASVYGKLEIMFPMITGVEQVRRIKELVAECRAELAAEAVPVAEKIGLGVMIETPAAAIMSDVLAKEVDFFSIGTNDLTQYTLAADRMNVRVNDIFDPADPAVLRLIELTARNAHAAGIWVGVCGEAGANTRLTPFFMRNKLDELSVSAASVLKVRKAICESEE